MSKVYGNNRKTYNKLSISSMMGGIKNNNISSSSSDKNSEQQAAQPNDRNDDQQQLNVAVDEQCQSQYDPNDESLKLLSPIQNGHQDGRQENMEFYYSDYEDDDSDEEDDDDDDDDDEDDDDGYAYDAPDNDAVDSVKSKFQSTLLADQELPSGWERHEDELGPYFWHIPTGTIQREKPVLDTIDKSMIRSDSLVFLDKSAINVDYNPEGDIIEEETENKEEDVQNGSDRWTKIEEDDDEDGVERKSLLSKKKVVANMRLTFASGDEDSYSSTSASEDEEIEKNSYLVHSLGWLPVDESQINQQTGAMVIKKCIFELANRSESAARAWETQSLTMKLSPEYITLVAPNTDKALTVQMIRDIRMWAVDEQNNFAYVVRDKQPTDSTNKADKPQGDTDVELGTESRTCDEPKVRCHVFHCEDATGKDKSAHKIALFLKEALMKIKTKQAQEKAACSRPNKLFPKNGRDLSSGEFPTPMEEPKTIPAFYMGMVAVDKPSGVGVLNHAIEELVTSLKLSLSPEDSESTLDRPVNVHISPANVIVECRDTGATILECRVRYLSFLGISLDSVSRCGFIMQVDERKFVAHCFHCYPTARLFCKTIEAACKLRYQKCIDSQIRSQNNQKTPTKTTPTNQSPTTPIQAIRSSISSLFSRIVNK